MRFTRLATATTAAALVAGFTAAIPAPAQAGTVTEPIATTTTAKPSAKAIEFGKTVSISGKVTAADSSAPLGTVTLYAARAAAGADREYKPITSKTTSGSYTFYDVKPRRNTYYGVTFTDDPGDDVAYGFSATESTYQVGVARDLDTRNPRGLKVVGKVRPTYKHKKVIVQRKQGKRWTMYKVLRTNRRSKFAVTLKAPGRRGATFRYRITVPGNKDYLRARDGWKVNTYRPATRITTR